MEIRDVLGMGQCWLSSLVAGGRSPELRPSSPHFLLAVLRSYRKIQE